MIETLAGRCLVCDRPLTMLESKEGGVCFQATCRWRYASTPAGHRCKQCGRPLRISELPIGLCSAELCRREQILTSIANERVRRRKRGLRYRTKYGKILGIRSPASFPLVAIPAYRAPSAPLPERRKRAFVTNLRAKITEAMSGHRETDPEPDGSAHQARMNARDKALASVLGRACATCQGRCCSSGGEHAYLTVDTIRRYLRHHPAQRAREVLAAYTRHLNGETFIGSCVYHRTNGCALPRELRSDTCNDYYCDGLRTYREIEARLTRPKGFFHSGLTKQHAVFAFIEADRIRAARPAASGPKRTLPVIQP